MQKTLVVHHRSGIGDLVWHIPYIRAIAHSSRNGKVTVLARPSCKAADVLAGESCVEEVMEYDRRPRNNAIGRHDGIWGQIQFLLELRRKKFDRIFIFSGRTRYALLAMLAGIPIRAGFGFGKLQRLFLNLPPYISRFEGKGSWVYPEASNFAIAHGFSDGPIVPKMMVPHPLIDEANALLAPLPHPRYALAIGSSDPQKNWGTEKFLVLGGILMDAGCGVIFLGGPAEREEYEKSIASSTGFREGFFRVMCQPSVVKSAAALKTCDFCVGNDTGILNVATACDLSALGIFGNTAPLTHDPLLHAISGSSMSDISVASVTARLAELGAPTALPTTAEATIS